ncbi:MAG: bacteriohemerythrin [Elusimicrobiaceae bacterium]
MALFNWDTSMSVGVNKFDEHHKKLVDMVNKLHDAMSSGKGNEVIGPILTELVRYTQYHFAEEEKLMTLHQYPDLAKHKAEHVALTKKALELMEQQKKGSIVVTVPVMFFLRDWLTTHIKGTDKKYGPFLNQKGEK